MRAFWPFWSLAIFLLALLMLGAHDSAPVEVVWTGGVLAGLGLLASLAWGLRRLRLPTRAEALARLDATLPGRPIQSLLDDQVIGGGDAASRAVWAAHQARMRARAEAARAPAPDLRIARRDPFGLRLVALVTLAVALLFGSFWRLGTVPDLAPGGAAALAGGPAWEGWVQPPAHTGLPTLYLADIAGPTLEVPTGSRITLRLYGEVGALRVTETVSGRVGELPDAGDPAQDFAARQPGRLEIDGPGGRGWDVALIADQPPQVAVTGPAKVSARGEMTLPFTASDDYGVTGGQARITLDMAALDRRYGLAAAPEPRDPIIVELPMPFTGQRDAIEEVLIEDFSKHPWANLPVRFELSVSDALEQEGTAGPVSQPLPARRFFDPLAAAVAEQRRDLLWSRKNAPQVAQLLRAVSHRPDGLFRKETAYLKLRVILRRLEAQTRIGLAPQARDELAEALWDLAVLLEEGDLGDALERLRRAQDRLSEAMKNGASDQEIAELMQELRDATQDYLRQLSRQAEQDGQEGDREQAENQNTMRMTQDDLQAMMDRIQDLMKQGRMEEAQRALDELQQMMENMRVTQGEAGEGQQSQGQQAMEGLSETLREQQGLSDRAFRDLQEQFNPGANRGQSQGNEGRSGGEGRGESHEGQGGRGTGDGQGAGEQGQQGQRQSLADRQEALRRELERQRGNLPGQGTEEGDAAREALRRADEAMQGAEEALRGEDLAEAIDRQAEAMEALREGMRNLGEALAQEQRNQGQQGEAESNRSASRNDPLGRNPGTNGQLGTDEGLLQGADVYRRARELLDEIRRRTGDGDRPELELDYLERLLERY